MVLLCVRREASRKTGGDEGRRRRGTRARWLFCPPSGPARLGGGLVTLSPPSGHPSCVPSPWHSPTHRKELLRGPTFYVLALIATTLAAWRTSPVSALVVALMCGGDGLADIVGRRWGGGARGRLPWNPAKSWAGSAAMFLGRSWGRLGNRER